jgi:hypothetical protein
MLVCRPPLEGQRHAIQSHVQILPREDAFLIAAAPRLLQACKSALTVLCATQKTAHCNAKPADNEYTRVAAELEAAIAEAEGR